MLVPETDTEANKPVQVYNLRTPASDEKRMQWNLLQAWVPARLECRASSKQERLCLKVEGEKD